MGPFIFFFILFFSSSFCDEDFNSKMSHFSARLLYYTSREYTDQDVLISPYIIWSLLMSMAYESLGLTWEEVSNVFYLTSDRSEGVEQFKALRAAVLVNASWRLESRNFLFYDESLHMYSDSITRLENDFGFTSRRLVFHEAEGAASAATQAMHSSFPPYFHDKYVVRTADFLNSTLILCNILSFTASWEHRFDAADTVQEYYRDGDDLRRSDMMKMRAWLRVSNFESLRASITELPYNGDGSYSLLLVRPHGGQNLERLLISLSEVALKDVLDKMQREFNDFGLKHVEVQFPKYASTSFLVLNKPLLNMGLSEVFDPKLANFSFAEDKTFIGEIAQRVSLIFNEGETLLHASTPGYVMNKTLDVKKIAVKNPFVFFIIEKSTATILFGGTYRYFDFIRYKKT